jgi:integrase
MYKRGDSWYSDFWYKGERYVESHGPVSKTVAKEKDRKFRTDAASGAYKKKQQDPHFDKTLDDHLKHVKSVNTKSTWQRYRQSAVFLKEHYGSKRISAIEGNEILLRKFIKKRKDQIKERQLEQGRSKSELSFTSINRDLALLRSMINVLIKAGKARINPVSLVTMFEENEKERILTAYEETRIIAEIEKADIRYQHLKDIMTIALNTGMRENEILGMKKSWIDLKEGIIKVPRQAQKRKKRDKRVPVNSAIRPIIKRLLKADPEAEYLILNPKTGTRFTKIYNGWTGIIKKAGLDGKPGVDKLRFHDLRHTAATNLARAGKDMKFIAQYLGHTDVKTSARYIHYSDEDLKKGAEVLVEVPTDFTTPKLRSL